MNRRMKIFVLGVIVLGQMCGYVMADTVITREKTYFDVYVMEGIHSFYILLPETGAIESIIKKDEDVISVIMDEPEKRVELKKKWDEKQTVSRGISKISEEKKGKESVPPTKTSKEQTTLISKRKGNASLSYSNDGIQTYPGDVTGTTLPGTLYSANVLPRTVNSRTYGFYNTGSGDSLPKIVLRNPPVSGGGYAGMNNFRYGMNAYPGAGGMGRMSMGYGYGMGMFRDVTVISNISDLFSTIDDRLVGEFSPVMIIHSSSTK